ncbi:signal recognition particle-docking protein FtsY [Halopiger goleimassiliensis]|uniref:signal recognition particle-docking protein FtsY n=1 Tax=Halopiger goleimassiliensis TaxID=1293048 RepID=UPI00067822CD|nr:signal recognition particle-docking protein FtsY [Halopiger goleimassiliensis]
MFDNLKEKLGSFRKDAEEAAEENVEEVDEDELDEEELADADLEADAEAAEAPDTTPEPGADAEAEPRAEPEAAAATDTAEARTGTETEPATAADATVADDEHAEPDATAEPSATADATAADAEADLESEPEPAEEDDEEDGDESGNNSTGFGRKAKSLVKGKFVIEEEDLEDPLYELEMALLSSDVEMNVAQEILDTIRDELVGETRTFTTSTGEVVEDALREAIHDVISVGQFDFDQRIADAEKPVTIVFTGVNGVGKTTSIAKLSRYFEQRGYSTVMANGDTYRAGANEQIEEHADALDTKLITHEQGGDPAAVLYDGVEYAEANDVDIVLGDTAGRLHTNEGLMDQLEKIDRVVDPDLTLFVDEAVAGQDAVNRAREFNEAAEIDGAILTKADADSNGGAAISIAHVTGKPILFLGVGQGYDDLERFDPDEMVDRLLEDDS